MSGGPVVPDIRAVWQANTVFSPGDVFTYLGGVYEVTTTYTSGASFGATDLANTTVWEAPTGTYAPATGSTVYAPLSSPQLRGTLKIVNNTSPTVTPIIELDGFGRQFQGPMIDTSNAGGGRDLVLVDMFNFRQVGDLVITNGSVNVTSALQARFGIKDNNTPIAGPGIPAGTTLVWATGTDGATAARLSQAATASGTITAIIGTNDGASLTDLFYVNEGGGQGTSFGFGLTPPPTSHRVAIAADDSVATQGNLRLRIGPSQTGDALTVVDSGGTTLGTLDSTGRWVNLKARTTLTLEDATLATSWQWSFPGGGVMRLRYTTGGVTVLDYGTDKSATFYGNVTVSGSLTIADTKNIILATGTGTSVGSATNQKTGFHGARVAQETVTGSRGGNAALADLITKLVNKGVIADGTSA